MNLPGGWEWIFIVLIILILFGAKRIPEMMRSMGQGIKEFKKATKDIAEDEESKPSAKEPAEE